MKLSDKILMLRKQSGISQEELADKLNVSRQAISRWEMGSAQPDANNILQISKLFSVTTDYLLNDDYESDNDLPKVKKVREDNSKQILIYLVTLEVMVLIIQFMCVFILQNTFFAGMSFLLFAAVIGGFEYAFQKKSNDRSDRMVHFRRNFYKISAWLGLYFPIRFLAMICMSFYPRPHSALVSECVILVIYVAAALLIDLAIEKDCLAKKK
ncbi:MAG: helix-turn-helix transcriptional regulator [Oscillibacter sp.]|nr:helix-turn-helix transcriptional regulator [Oscillibacter sp.]